MLNPADHAQGFAKVHLRMSRRMAQRHKNLLGPARSPRRSDRWRATRLTLPNVNGDNRDPAGEPILIAQPYVNNRFILVRILLVPAAGSQATPCAEQWNYKEKKSGPRNRSRIVCIGSESAELEILREYSDFSNVNLRWNSGVAADLVVLLHTDHCCAASHRRCAFDFLPDLKGEGHDIVTGRDMPNPVVSAAVHAEVLVLPWEELLVSTLDHLLSDRSLERYAKT